MNDRLAVPGTLLLSVPQMLDPNFMHTVVLMVQHSSTGAFGLVVNRDAVTTVKMLFPEHALLSLVNFPVHAGGPVGQDSFQFLHCVPDAIAGGIELSDGLFLGGDLDSFAEYVATEDRAFREVRCFVGYSGWGEGQLDGELQIGSWLPLPLNKDYVFMEDPPEVVWRDAIRSLGGLGEGLANQPPDISWN